VIGHARLPSFSLTDAELGMGASFGNSEIWVNTKSTGAVERLFLNALGQSLIGTISLEYGTLGLPLSVASHVDPSARGVIALRPEAGKRRFKIHPAYQRLSFELGSELEIEETTFVPFAGGEPGRADPPLVYVVTKLRNTGVLPHRLRVLGSARLRGSTEPDVRARFESGIRAIVAFNESQPQAVRIFGVCQGSPRFEVGFDFGRIYDPTHVHPLQNSICGPGDVIGQLQLDVTLGPAACRVLSFVAGGFVAGEAASIEAYGAAPDHEYALQATIAHLEDVIGHSEVLTPDPLINEGALWSKVNARRVMAEYPQGAAFTNDPGNTANVVVRDSAWFVYGNDHFMPEFSRRLLDNIGSRQYANGKLPEYYDAITGEIADDELNINDDTPLYILAVNHHFRSAGDLEWLRGTYPRVAAAGNYIISQMDNRALVFCSAHDPRGNVWASASWRNIIERYSISGAVTEINAECVAALRAASHLAENLGQTGDDAKRFAEASRSIQDAMDEHLINPENGLYYLNIDVDGNVHTDVTGDELFPVMFRTCDENTGFRIISRLNAPDFWTAAGLRTVSRYDPLYDPSHYWGLMGGVWPGLTWWYAFAAARYHPEFMVRALRSSFEHYAVDPKKNNTVPGQFSEWFDGESLTNKGMRLSPWEPPRFLWAAVEGVCGLMVLPGRARVSPIIPSHWSWVGMRRLPYHGAFVSYFAVRREDGRLGLYSTAQVDSQFDVTVLDRDVTDDVRCLSDPARIIALAGEDETVILVGNTSTETVAASLNVERILDASKRYALRAYNSERKSWEEPILRRPGAWGAVALLIEAGGFQLLRFTPEGT
jgi:Bacterial alpha-L-rhamnosidase 6 hairpin glycosidase domain